MQIDWYDVGEKAEKARNLAGRITAISDLRRSLNEET